MTVEEGGETFAAGRRTVEEERLEGMEEVVLVVLGVLAGEVEVVRVEGLG